MLTHLSLFTGIGGIDLAAEKAGFETVGQCEFADYPTKVLEKHWPDVPKWRDIRDVTRDSFRARTGLHTIDLISGGFPCQPFSVAGKQKGKEDDRYLWPEMLRVIRELKPRWVLGENVPGILRIAGDTVCQDLEREGYDIGIFNFEAVAIGAGHRRERVFFVANSKSCGRRGGGSPSDSWERWGLEYGEEIGGAIRGKVQGCHINYLKYPETAPAHIRGNYGLPDWLDRVRAIGNAVMPQQVYPILMAIAQVERDVICTNTPMSKFSF